MKICTLMMIPLVSMLITPIFDAIAATSKGSMTLNLTGEIDMNINPSQSQQISGSLSGTTSFNATPVYSGSGSSAWATNFAIISLSQQDYRCNAQFVTEIPNHPNKYGLKLTHSSNNNTAVYVTPEFNFSVSLSNFGNTFESMYGGQFFRQNNNLIDVLTPDRKVCFVPKNYTAGVPSGGNKLVTISTPGTFPVYIDSYLTPGTLTYQGTRFYVGSFGGSTSVDYYLTVNINANILVKRSCKVTNITNQQINENMTHTGEVIRDSTFTLSCGGLGNPVNISAVIKEGTLDSTNSRKLVLAPINGTVSEKKPWVIGLPYRLTSPKILTCSDDQRNDLIKFNNTDLVLPGVTMGNNKADDFGIKWALCKPDGTKAGEYRGKVDVNIFVRG